MYQDADELCGVEAFRREWIETLVRNLCDRIALKELYLFGSRAIDQHLTWSDYDLCVISDDFAALRPWERMELVLSCWEGQRALEPVCLTSQEFEQSQYTLIEEIRRKAKRLYP